MDKSSSKQQIWGSLSIPFCRYPAMELVGCMLGLMAAAGGTQGREMGGKMKYWRISNPSNFL